MAGTKAGGAAAAATNKEKYGPDFYQKIGAIGGSKGRTGGFYANRELARSAGAKGGAISRRTKGGQYRTDSKFLPKPGTHAEADYKHYLARSTI